MTTTTTTTDVETAVTTVAELEAQHMEAQQESARAQAHAAALPTRLAAGDESVTTDDLVQAGPAAAVAQAKAHAVGQKLAAARAALERARGTELVAQLRAGDPFMDYNQVGKELDRIAVYVSRELEKLGKQLEAHNHAFLTVAGGVSRGTSRIFPAGEDGAALTIQHDHNGLRIELDGRRWTDMQVMGWGSGVLQRVERVEAQARDAAKVPAPMFTVEYAGIDAETLAGMIG